MANEQQIKRRRQIEAAAFEVLEEVGYRKASMLQIAKRARASNETLYAWYGNKQALFSSIIEENANTVKTFLQEAVDGQDDPSHCLATIGQLLLQFMATEKAISMNRAAIADAPETGLLADAIEKGARKAMLGSLSKLMARLEKKDHYHFGGKPDEAVNVYISLLIGEVQMQQLLGTIAPLSIEEIEKRRDAAMVLFDRLYKRER